MKIKSVHVQNFRCIKDEQIELERLNALVGRNGTGKSAFLHALKFFYEPAASYSEDDFYNRRTSSPIVISVTFSDLSGDEKELFEKYIRNEELIVEKELTFPRGRSSQKYYGKLPRCPEFEEVRDEDKKVPEKREAYFELYEESDLPDLPDLNKSITGKDLEKELEKWEENHPDHLELCRDRGQFFGFKEVGSENLEKFTRFVDIPAVQDASEEAMEGSNSTITELMDILVRSTLESREELDELKKEVISQYEDILQPEGGFSELNDLQDELRGNLKTLVPGSDIHISWDMDLDVSLPTPEAEVKLEEDDFRAPVDRVGHGLQRAFIFSVLQELAQVKATQTQVDEEGETENTPSLILAIEEVELYQHPSRQRHLASILTELSSDPPPGISSLQVLYSTHSPLFIDVKRFDDVSLFRKVVEVPDRPKVTDISTTTLDKIIRRKEEIEEVDPGTYDVDPERARLKTLMTPWTNEGFFSDVVVLVEGIEDRAAIIGMASEKRISLEEKNISVIPVNGKNNLLKAILMFQSYQIDTYALWDSDENQGEDGDPEENKKLQKAFNYDEVQDFLEMSTDSFTCFKNNITQYIKNGLGHDFYAENLEDLKDQYGFNSNRHAKKNVEVVGELISRGLDNGKNLDLIEDAVNYIVELSEG